MAYKITLDCIGCGACDAQCKNDAIFEGKIIFIINAEKCTECVGYFNSPKCAEVCPVGACVPDSNYKESKEQLLDKWHKLHPGEKSI